MGLQRAFEGEDVVEDVPNLHHPPDVHLQNEDEGHQQGDRPDVQNGAAQAVEEAGQLLGEDVGKVQEKDRKEEDSGEDDLHPHQGRGGPAAVDHDQLPGVPGHKGKDQQGKDAVDNPLRVVEEDDEAQGQVNGKGQRRWQGIDAHWNCLILLHLL